MFVLYLVKLMRALVEGGAQSISPSIRFSHCHIRHGNQAVGQMLFQGVSTQSDTSQSSCDNTLIFDCSQGLWILDCIEVPIRFY